MLPARGVNSSFRPTLDSPSRFLHYARPSFRALVAQLDRALGFEPRCRGFESSRARQYYSINKWLPGAFRQCPRNDRVTFCAPNMLEIQLYEAFEKAGLIVLRPQTRVRSICAVLPRRRPIALPIP